MILIIDTVRHSGEHMQLNEAVLNGIECAKNEKIIFLTSKKYWDSFSDHIKDKLIFEETSFLSSGVYGTFKTLVLLIKIIFMKRNFTHIIFLSSITYNSFFLSIFSRMGLIKSRLIIFLHEVSYINIQNNNSIKLAAFFLKLALKIGLSKQSKFVITGEYIKKELQKKVLFKDDSVFFIEHPTTNYTVPKTKLGISNLIRLASVGVQCLEKNSNKIEDLALFNENLINDNQIEISTIGRIDYEFNPNSNVKHHGLNYNDYLIPKIDFESLIIEQSYFLLFLDSKYNLKTSGVFFDAIKFEKPIIALECNLTNFYFEKFGDIGFLFKNFDEMISGVSEITKTKNEDHYNCQVSNIKSAKKFTNETSFNKQIKYLLSN